MARARRVHCPTVRITRGKSFGPMTTRATTAITASSDQAKSNIGYFTIVLAGSGPRIMAEAARRRKHGSLGSAIASVLVLVRGRAFTVVFFALARHVGQSLTGGHADRLA